MENRNYERLKMKAVPLSRRRLLLQMNDLPDVIEVVIAGYEGDD